MDNALGYEPGDGSSILSRGSNVKEIKMKIRLKPIAAPRNPFVKLALFKKAGSHTKSNKALRRQQNSKGTLAQLAEQ